MNNIINAQTKVEMQPKINLLGLSKNEVSHSLNILGVEKKELSMRVQQLFSWIHVHGKKSFDEIYPELAKKHKVAFVPFLLKGVALNPSYNLDDGKHPNPEGVKLISKNLPFLSIERIIAP